MRIKLKEEEVEDLIALTRRLLEERESTEWIALYKSLHSEQERKVHPIFKLKRKLERALNCSRANEGKRPFLEHYGLAEPKSKIEKSLEIMEKNKGKSKHD